MKKLRNTLIFSAIVTAIFIAIMLSMPGCLGEAARQNTLVPAVCDGWADLRPYAVIPDSDAQDPAIGAMDAAAANKDADAIAAAWPAVKPLVTAGIDLKLEAGTLSASMAESLDEKVRRMDKAVDALAPPG